MPARGSKRTAGDKCCELVIVVNIIKWDRESGESATSVLCSVRGARYRFSFTPSRQLLCLFVCLVA